MIYETLPDKFWYKMADGSLVKHSRHEAMKEGGQFGADYPYPATLRFSTESVQLTKPWWDYIRSINGVAGWEAGRRVNGGWLNSAGTNREIFGGGNTVPDKTSIFPKCEPVTSVGNKVNVLEWRGDWAYIEVFDVHDAPPDPNKVNKYSHPHLFCRFTSIAQNESIGLAPNGQLFFFPLLSKDGTGRLNRDQLKKVEDATMPEPTVSTLAKDQGWAIGGDFSKYDKRYEATKFLFDFVIIKASEGTVPDPAFQQLLQDSAPVPVKGAYHYYRRGVNWKAQADTFLGIIYGTGVHFLAIDYELKGNTFLDKATDNEVRQIIDYVAQQSGLPVLLYAQHNMLTAEMIARKSDWVKTYPVWVARWFSTTYFDTKATGPGIPFVIWQWGGDYLHPSKTWWSKGYKEGRAYGVQKDSIDLNYYKGTLAEMKAWLKIGEGPVLPPQEAEPLTMEQRVERIEDWILSHGGF